MTTSDNFNIFPAQYNDVLFRTFENLTGFNKKGKKGKYVKALKEEWIIDPITGEERLETPAEEKKRKDAKEYEFRRKIENGSIKVINLDRKKSAKSKESSSAKKEAKVTYTGHLVNKVGKTDSQIANDLKARTAGTKAVKDTFKDDTDYTVEEIVDYCWDHSKKVRDKFSSPKAFTDALKGNAKLRQFFSDKMVKIIGSKEVKETKTRSKKNAEPAIDLDAVVNYFWANKGKYSFISDISAKGDLRRMLAKDPDSLKQLNTIMKNTLSESIATDDDKAVAKKATDDVNKAIGRLGIRLGLINKDGKVLITMDKDGVTWSVEVGQTSGDFSFNQVEAIDDETVEEAVYYPTVKNLWK